MFPILEVPPVVSTLLSQYREVFCREAGFEWVSRYVTGLLVSPNKTLQGIYDLQVFPDCEQPPSRRAMHEAVFEAGWDCDLLTQQHRQLIAPDYRSNTTWKVVSMMEIFLPTPNPSQEGNLPLGVGSVMPLLGGVRGG
jgi:hypothetical protein